MIETIASVLVVFTAMVMTWRAIVARRRAFQRMSTALDRVREEADKIVRANGDLASEYREFTDELLDAAERYRQLNEVIADRVVDVKFEKRPFVKYRGLTATTGTARQAAEALVAGPAAPGKPVSGPARVVGAGDDFVRHYLKAMEPTVVTTQAGVGSWREPTNLRISYLKDQLARQAVPKGKAQLAKAVPNFAA